MQKNNQYSEKYLKFVKYCQNKNIQLNLTNTQHYFAEFLLKNIEEIDKIGDLEFVFLTIRKYLKNEQ